MAGLVFPNAEAIAQIVVQHMSGTGACVIDLLAAAPVLTICNSIEIRFIQQDVIEGYADSICIEPTEATPVEPVFAPAEPKPSRVKHPPGREGSDDQSSPGRTKSSPVVLDDGDEDCNHDDGDVVTPADPAEAEPLPSRVPVQERPVIPEPSLPSVSWPLVPPAGPSGIGGNSSVVFPTNSTLPFPSAPTSSASSTTSSVPFSLLSPPSSSVITPSTTPVSEPKTPASTRVPSRSRRPRPPSSTSRPTPTPTAPVRLPQDDPPDPPPPSSPSPPQLPSASITPPPPPPDPTHVAPDPCQSAYTSINVTNIRDVDPGSYDQYLHLVGIDLAQHHPKHSSKDAAGTSATSQAEVEEALVHQFRVRCDVGLPEGPAPVFPDIEGGEEHTRVVREGHRGCLEMCEREAILKAGDGLLHECLGVAYRRKTGGPEGEGDCRFWSADRNENMFLPVHMLPSTKGKGERWQVLYM